MVAKSRRAVSSVAHTVASALARVNEEEEEKVQLGLGEDPVHDAAMHDAEYDSCLLYTSPSPRDRG